MSEKIIEINAAHEEALDQIRKRETEVSAELDALRREHDNNAKSHCEVAEIREDHQTQTEWIDSSTSPMERFRKVSTTRFQCMAPRKELRSVRQMHVPKHRGFWSIRKFMYIFSAKHGVGTLEHMPEGFFGQQAVP